MGKILCSTSWQLVRKTNKARQHGKVVVVVIEGPYTWAIGKLTISEEDLRSKATLKRGGKCDLGHSNAGQAGRK